MKRLLLVVVVALVLVAMLAASATPVFAGPPGHHGHGHQALKHCKPPPGNGC